MNETDAYATTPIRLSSDEMTGISVTLCDNPLERKHWENNFVSDTGDKNIHDEISKLDSQGKLTRNPMMASFLKNQFLSVETPRSDSDIGRIKISKEAEIDVPKLQKIRTPKNPYNESIEEDFDMRKRRVFINCLCNVLMINKDVLQERISFNKDPIRYIVDQALWIKPTKISPASLEQTNLVISKIIELYKIPIHKVDEIRDKKSFRDFIIAAMEYEAQTLETKRNELDSKNKLLAWGITEKNAESAGLLPGTVDELEKIPTLCKDIKIAKSPNNSTHVNEESTMKKLNPAIPAFIPGVQASKENPLSLEHSMKQLANVASTLLQKEAKKVTITMTFEL